MNIRGKGLTRYPDEYPYQTLGLIRLPLMPQRFSCFQYYGAGRTRFWPNRAPCTLC
jgi:hypothetical protein